MQQLRAVLRTEGERAAAQQTGDMHPCCGKIPRGGAAPRYRQRNDKIRTAADSGGGTDGCRRNGGRAALDNIAAQNTGGGAEFALCPFQHEGVPAVERVIFAYYRNEAVTHQKIPCISYMKVV